MLLGGNVGGGFGADIGAVIGVGAAAEDQIVAALDQPPQAAPAEPTQPPGPLSVLDFRRRFTLHEKAAIEFAALDNPAAPIEERQQAALLRACLADQAAAQFIDLADPSTIEGVQLLVQAGLLSEERGQQVLLASAAP